MTPPPTRSLRLRPGVILAVLVVLVWFVIPAVAPRAMVFGASVGILSMLAGIAGALAILVWWLAFSRAPWLDRIAAPALMALAVLAMRQVVHPSISNAGMGMMLYFFAAPVLSVALVAWARATCHLSATPRRAWMAVVILVAVAPFALLRTGGVDGDGHSDLHWRWTMTPEERLLASGNDLPGASAAPAARSEPPAAVREAAPSAGAPPSPAAVPAAAAPAEAAPAVPPASGPPAEWPGFRGPARDGVVHAAPVGIDWVQSPPVALWRRPIGPGWSSFAVQGDLIYTQEQRGAEEVVSSYRLSSGEPVWRHADPVRFWESNAGAGPRATPTLANGRVYAMGATGVVNALDARTGTVLWSRNAATDTKREIPDWGLASSPLVVGDLVIVAAAGRLAAYDAATGQPRWFGPEGGGGYSSPHLATIDGVEQVLLLRGSRTISVAPATGALLWDHTWEPAVSIVQPAVVDGDVLIAAGDAMGGNGMRRISVRRAPAGAADAKPGAWLVEERWTSNSLKPYYNDYVVHHGHAFGFDGSILACVDLADGKRKWKGGRYGHGQLVLLPEQDLLLVLSEEGELALVSAIPDGFKEIARVPAIAGKTWNHPVVVRDILLVRNGEEMAAFRLPTAARAASTSK